MVNDFISFVRIARFDILPLSRFTVGLPSSDPGFDYFLITFWQKGSPGAGVTFPSSTGERAVHNLEGGGRSLLEGLGHSRGP